MQVPHFINKKGLPEAIKSITILGRRWFSATYGNTYHSVIVLVNGIYFTGVDFEYGYGKQYEQTGWSILVNELGLPVERYQSGGTEAPWRFCERHEIAFYSTAVNVARKQDL